MPQSNRWCFTLNNYTDDDVRRLRALEESVRYLVIGRETGAEGTPHLQGFVVFNTRLRLTSVKRSLGNSCHVEVARGTSSQAADYCKKDGNFEEFGILPNPQGKTNTFEDLKTWVQSQPTKPTKAQIAELYPRLYLQYGRVMEWVDLIYPQEFVVPGEYRNHQSRLADQLILPADDRTITFIVDPVGGTGKSWFIKKWLSDHADITQVLSIGKRDDLAYAIDPAKSVFLFDLPRSQSEFLQYSVLEQLKDRIIFSPKYTSTTKTLNTVPHVVVFMNEEPDRNKLSVDRYDVINWHTLA